MKMNGPFSDIWSYRAMHHLGKWMSDNVDEIDNLLAEFL